MTNTTKGAETEREGGFTLVEALVALFVAALALTTLYRAIGGALTASRRAEEQAVALAVTQSRLDAATRAEVLSAGITSGAAPHGLTWRMTVSDLGRSQGEETPSPHPYWIVVETLDRAGHMLVKLETAAIAREAQ